MRIDDEGEYAPGPSVSVPDVSAPGRTHSSSLTVEAGSYGASAAVIVMTMVCWVAAPLVMVVGAWK